MKAHKEQKVYHKLTFSIGHITEDEALFVRNAMDKLEQEDPVMRCFQNVNGHVIGKPFGSTMPDFVIYYRGEHVDCIERFLFKIQLKFPGFVAHATHTLQEYYS